MRSFLWGVRVKSPFSTILFWILAFITLDEADPAGITTAPLKQTVQLSKNVPFYRWVDENPTPTITWVHESSVGRGNKLHFGLTRFTDAGWYTYDAESGKGGRAYLDVTGSESRLINGKMMILNEKLDVGLLKKESVEKYQNFSKRIAQVVEDLFKADINYYATKVIQFESGCVKVSFKLEFKRIVRASIIISTLKYAAMDGKFGSFIVDPSSITVLQDETPASSSKNSTGQEASPLIGFFFLLVVFVVIYFVLRPSEQSTTSSSVVPASGAGQSTGGTRPPQDVYQLYRVKPDRTKEEEKVVRLGNHEMYETLREMSDGTRERQVGVRGDNVPKFLSTEGRKFLALDNK